MAVAYILLIPLLALLGGVFFMRARTQGEKDRQRLTYVVSFPSDIKAEQLTDWLHSIAGGLQGRRFLRGLSPLPSLAFEVWANAEHGRVQHLRLPYEAMGILEQLKEFVPDVVIAEAREPKEDFWMRIVEIGESNPDRLLRFDPHILARSLRRAIKPDDLGDGEEVVLQVVVAPCPPAEQQPEQNQPKIVGGPMTALAASFLRPPRNNHIAEAKEKLSETNFNAVIRIAARARSDSRAYHLVENVADTLRSINGPGNKFVRTHVPASYLPARLNNATSPVRWPARLSTTELAGLIGWPLSNPHSSSQSEYWHMWPDSRIPETGIVLANSTVPGQKRSLALEPMDFMSHVWCPGRTSSGKSTVLENIAVQWMEQGHGLTFLDPHGDSAENLLDLIPKNRILDVIYLDPTDVTHPVGFNLIQGDSPSLITSYLMGVFESIFGAGPLTGHVLRNTIYTIALQDNMTLYEVALALDDPDFRDEITRSLTDDQLKRYWTRFENLSRAEQSQSTEPVMRRLAPFLTPEFKGVFGQSGGVDMKTVLDHGRILIVRLSQGELGEGPASLFGAMVVAKLWQEIRGRSAIPIENRTPHLLIADEFQKFVKLPTSIGDMAAEARKFRLGLVLANQLMDQIRDIRLDLQANIRNKIILNTLAQDAAALAREIGVKEEDIRRLGRYEAILSLTHNNQPMKPVTGYTLPPSTPNGAKEMIRFWSRIRNGRAMAQVEQEIAARRKPQKGPKRQRPTVGGMP